MHRLNRPEGAADPSASHTGLVQSHLLIYFLCFLQFSVLAAARGVPANHRSLKISGPRGSNSRLIAWEELTRSMQG